MSKDSKIDIQNPEEQLIMDSILESIWSIDLNYNLIAFNDLFKNAILKECGFKAKKGVSVKHINPEAFKKLWKPNYDKVFIGKNVFFEYCLDDEKYFEVKLLPIILDNTVVGLTAYSNDIFERKNAELELVETYNIISSSPLVIFHWINDNSWNTSFVTENVYKLLGYRANDFMSGKVSYKEIIHPDDFDRVTEEMSSFSKSKMNEVLMQEYRVIIKDGTLKWVRDFPSFRRDKNNNITHFNGVIHDITKQKIIQNDLIESEEKFKEFFEKSSDALSIIKNGIFIDCNFATCEMLGYSTKKEFLDLNTHPSKLSPKVQPDGRDSFKKGEEILKATYEKGSQLFEWVHTKKNGENFPVEVLLSVISNEPDNKILYCVWRDISERKKDEEKKAKYRTQLEEENIYLKDEIALSFNYEDIVYSSEEISDVLTQVEQVSSTNATVLILGETGTGKELIAKAIHNTSNRKNNSLIRVNCAAIPSELLESELFGHIKGSFTGAIKNRIGKFELANKGSLFLDEIGEIPLVLQSKLLRAIQEGEIDPIGSSETRKLDVRIIAATNKDLKKEAEEKRFREDLYFRLNVFPITIPPLRQRIDDIPVLIDHFVNKYCSQYGKNIKYISDVTLQQMKSYSWPGNIRELENLIERAVIISNQELLVFQEFETSTETKAIKHISNTLEEIQRNHIIKILNQTQWKIDGKEGAAIILDVKPSTLRDRMKKLGIKKSNP